MQKKPLSNIAHCESLRELKYSLFEEISVKADAAGATKYPPKLTLLIILLKLQL